jgi:hypothetical protein
MADRTILVSLAPAAAGTVSTNGLAKAVPSLWIELAVQARGTDEGPFSGHGQESPAQFIATSHAAAVVAQGAAVKNGGKLSP